MAPVISIRPAVLLLGTIAATLASSCDSGIAEQPGPAGQISRAQMVYNPASGQTLMFAGFPSNGQTASSPTTSLEWAWNGISGWANLVDTSIPRFGIAVYSGIDKGILYYSPGQPLDFNPDGTVTYPDAPIPTLWLKGTGNWQNISTSDLPKNVTRLLSMVYDSKNKEVLLAGVSGSNENLWSWNGSHWNDLWNGPLSDPPRWVFSSPDGAVLSVTPNSATERWNGFSWVSTSFTGAPSSSFASFAYIPDKGKTVVYSIGKNGAPADPATYVFDGKSWTKITGASPSARVDSAVGWDGNGNVILYGGTDTNYKRLSDTWQFDGSNWKQVG